MDAPGSGRRWARRGVYRLQDSLEVEVEVPKGGTSVFARVYTEASQRAPTLTFKVDDGRPRLKTGIVTHPTTPTQRRTPRRTGRTARLIDQEAGRLQAHQGVLIALGDDLAPGMHRVSIQLPSTANPVYIRFDSAAGLPSSTDDRRHWYAEGVRP